jgi:hypothetical protein
MMSILTWLKAVTHGDENADFIQSNPITFAANEEQFHGLDMKEALDAHTQWYQRLEDKITGKSQEELNVAHVACDDRCLLGQWLRSEAKQHFGLLSSYEELRRIHADFHYTAGQVLNNVLNGEELRARDELRKVRHKSGGVQLALVRLYAEAKS